MGYPYSGGTINNTLYTSDGTRASLLTACVNALTAAGWATISGGGSSDVLMEATTPQGLKIRFRLFDPGGSNNCIQISMKNGTGSLTGTPWFFQPTNAVVYRLLAGPTWFFFFISGSANVSTARGHVAGGTIWVPSDVLSSLSGADLYAGWSLGQGTTDTDTNTTTRLTFRNTLSPRTQTSAPASSCLYKGTLSSVSNSNGSIELKPASMLDNSAGYTTTTWEDGSFLNIEALLAWGGVVDPTNTKTFKGILYDALVSANGYATEQTITHDSKTWIAITNNNSSGFAGGTLCVLGA